jgi:hypothetical protein
MRIGNLKNHTLALFLSDKAIRRVTTIISPTEVFRLTRRTYGQNKKPLRDRTDGAIHLGRPNYAERQLINRMSAKDFPKTLVKIA